MSFACSLTEPSVFEGEEGFLVGVDPEGPADSVMGGRLFISFHDFADELFGLVFVDVFEAEGGVGEGVFLFVVIFVVHFPLEELDLFEGVFGGPVFVEFVFVQLPEKLCVFVQHDS